jgi:hypothetical protein
MRVMENMQVYRARLSDGRAPYTLAEDLKRGSFGYASTGGGYRTGGSSQ